MSLEEKKHFFGGWDWVALGLFILGAVSRFWTLGAKSLWFDEITGAVWASHKSIGDILSSLSTDSHPPLTAILSHLFLALGKTGIGSFLAGMFAVSAIEVREFWLRFYPALCAVVTFPVVYFFIRRHAGKLAAIFTVVFMLLSPMNLFYSQDARPYAPWLLFACLASYFYLLALKENKLKYWLGFGLATLASLYTHYFAVLPLMAQGIYILILLVFPRWATAQGLAKPTSLLLRFIIFAGACTVLFVPALLQGLSSQAGFTPPDPPFTLSVSAYYDLASNLGLGYLQALLMVLVLFGTGFWLLCREGKSAFASFMLIMFLLLFLAAPLIIASTTKFWSVRFAYVAQWPMLGLAGSGAALFTIKIVKGAPPVWRQIYASILILAISATAFYWSWLPLRTYYFNEKQDIRQATRFVQANRFIQESVIAYPENLTGLFNYYKGTNGPVSGGAEMPRQVLEQISENSRAFIFTTKREITQDLDKANLPYIYLEFEKIAVVVVDKNWQSVPYADRFTELRSINSRTETISMAEEDFEAGMPENALPLLKGWCKAHPDDTPVLAKYAQCLAMMGESQEALHEIDETIVRDGGNAWLWVIRANYLIDLDKTREAIWSLRMASFLAPDNLSIKGMLSDWTHSS